MRVVYGNLLDAVDDVDLVVNPVNCVGVAGKGLALQFKREYPSNYNAYCIACSYGVVIPGHVFVYTVDTPFGEVSIANLPTKKHWRDPSKLSYISRGLESLERYVKEHSLSSVALPMLGCGEGGLSWSKVRPLIEDFCDRMVGVEVRLYTKKQ